MNRVRLTALVAVIVAVVLVLWLGRPEPAPPSAESVPSVASSTRAPARARAPARTETPRADAFSPEAVPPLTAYAEVMEQCQLRTWTAEGGLQVQMWLDGFGEPCDPDDALLTMDVVDERGLSAEDAWIVPVDCDGLRPGPPRITRLPPGRCTLRAMRRDGALFARSEPVTVEVSDDDTAYVQLELASTRTGGIGVRFSPDDAGIRVVDVVEGSPAEEAGLHPGDLVLDVGGVPTAGMDADTFVEHMTGAEHTDVTFTVGWDDDTGMVRETVTVVRQFLEG